LKWKKFGSDRLAILSLMNLIFYISSLHPWRGQIRYISLLGSSLIIFELFSLKLLNYTHWSMISPGMWMYFLTFPAWTKLLLSGFKVDKQTDRKTERKKDRKTNRQIDRMAGKTQQTESGRHHLDELSNFGRLHFENLKLKMVFFLHDLIHFFSWNVSFSFAIFLPSFSDQFLQMSFL